MRRKKPYPSSDEIKQRLLDKIRIDDKTGCWIWTASIGGPGYGQLSVCGRPHAAHRLSYQVHVGEIPEGLFIDHLCRNRPCINPAHLEPVTHQVNMARGMGGKAHAQRMRERTHCKKGHPLTPDNIQWAERGKRHCKICYQTGVKERNDRRKRVPIDQRRPNVADIARTKTHCPKGHPYSGENLRITKRGGRICRQCERAATREHQRKKIGYYERERNGPHVGVKLSDEMIQELRSLVGTMSQKELAKKFGISRPWVSEIVSGKARLTPLREGKLPGYNIKPAGD